MAGKRYEPWEEELIVALFQSDFERLKALLPHRSAWALGKRASALKVRARTWCYWTKAEDDLMRSLVPNMALIAEKLPHRSRIALKTRLQVLGLAVRKPWNPTADAILTKLSPNHSDVDLAKILGRSPLSIATRRWALGIKRGGHPAPKQAPQVVIDIELQVGGSNVQLRPLARQLGCGRLQSGHANKFNANSAAVIVVALGGQLYAEWDD